MLIWCSYCQEFQNEAEPFENLTVSHGICPSCTSLGSFTDESHFVNVEKLVKLQRELYDAGKACQLSRVPELLDMCIRIGVKPLDMIFGFLNPMFEQIGTQWQQGKSTIVEEHKFTQFAETLLAAIQANIESKSKVDLQKKMLLASADGNHHTFGLKLLHLWLVAEGVPVDLITPGIPINDLLTYTLKSRPQYVGISISLPDQIYAVKNYLRSLDDELGKTAPTVYLGGYAIKSMQVEAKEIKPAMLISDVRQLKTLILNKL